MLYIRSLLFNIAGYSIIGSGCVFNSLLGLISKRATIKTWNYFFIPLFILALRYIAGITIELRGTEHINQTSGIYAGKHQSAVETFVLTGFLKNATYVLKKELIYIPFFGWAQAMYGMIPIDRSAGSAAMKIMLRRAKELSAQARPIIIFPEGTRKSPEQTPDYKPGVALLYQHLGLPVIPIACNTGFFWRKNSFLRYPGKIIFEFMPPIAPSLNKQEFMQQLQNAIETKCHELNLETLRDYPHLRKMLSSDYKG
ncbi:MAG: 1-acyl-sn-glycerol-3-phosphate acyltransferase [Alphaproteobacteria bacterium]|nr:1-acyl-sn-glycerol-3-phosphate acyltransferase [Alphaproteobacteria bacterium]